MRFFYSFQSSDVHSKTKYKTIREIIKWRKNKIDDLETVSTEQFNLAELKSLVARLDELFTC